MRRTKANLHRGTRATLNLPWLFTATVAIACTIGDAHAQNRPTADGNFQPVKVVPPQEPITDPPLLSADRVRGQVTGNELVLGVEVNGEARAYPINMLVGPKREIVNDTLGGVPIAATW